MIRLTMPLFVVLCVAGGIGCSQGPVPNGDPGRASGAPVANESSDPGPEDSALLPTPFTAEQIRAEWIEGLQLVIERRSLADERLERWTVVSADDDGAVIEYAEIDAFGNVSGQPTLRRSSWQELRDHASFPADRATRERLVRRTPLGELDGWLYTVRDDERHTVSEFFFASELPGAPVAMEIVEEGRTLFALEQLERYRPAG